MKKFILSLVLFSCTSLGAARTFAQSADSLQMVVDSLSGKITKLEHDLAYLKIRTDISTLDAKIEILSLNVKDILTTLQLAILSNRTEDIKDVLRGLHKTYEENAESLRKEVNSIKELVGFESDTTSFDQIPLILNVAGILSSYGNLEKQISLVGEALDKIR